MLAALGGEISISPKALQVLVASFKRQRLLNTLATPLTQEDVTDQERRRLSMQALASLEAAEEEFTSLVSLVQGSESLDTEMMRRVIMRTLERLGEALIDIGLSPTLPSEMGQTPSVSPPASPVAAPVAPLPSAAAEPVDAPGATAAVSAPPPEVPTLPPDILLADPLVLTDPVILVEPSLDTFKMVVPLASLAVEPNASMTVAVEADVPEMDASEAVLVEPEAEADVPEMDASEAVLVEPAAAEHQVAEAVIPEIPRLVCPKCNEAFRAARDPREPSGKQFIVMPYCQCWAQVDVGDLEFVELKMAFEAVLKVSLRFECINGGRMGNGKPIGKLYLVKK